MIAIGQLLRTLDLRLVVQMVSAETTVEPYLLMEDTEFLRQVQNADNIQQVVDWVDENY